MTSLVWRCRRQARIAGKLFVVANQIIQPREVRRDQTDFFQIGICVTPPSAQICPKPVSQNFGQSLLGLLPVLVALGVRIEHPFAKAFLIVEVEAQSQPHGLTKLVCL